MAPAEGLVAARERLREAELNLFRAVGVRMEYEHALLGLEGKPRVLFRSTLGTGIDAIAARNPSTFGEWVNSAKECEAKAVVAYARAAEALWLLERGVGPHEFTGEVST